jgi:UDP-2,3-diacylglucosamine pyrophosphatase LpxH
MLTTGNKYKTIILSDIHLGLKDSKSREVVEFLTDNTTDRLILNGDIIDGWALSRGSKWKGKHMDCVKKIIKLSKKSEVIYLTGNHDEFLREFSPTRIGYIKIMDNFVLESGDKKFLVLHGDVFDMFITDMKWLAKIGSVAYDLALFINRWYNRYRKLVGKDYLSISKKLKDSVKIATKFIGDFEDHLVNLSKKRGYDGVICGHIHQPTIKTINNVVYMNSGDWVENMSALVETHDGEWFLKFFK